MNKARRNLLRAAEAALETAEQYISSAIDGEEDCFDNVPENLQCGERYEKMELTIDKLTEAIENITNARDCISEAVA